MRISSAPFQVESIASSQPWISLSGAAASLGGKRDPEVLLLPAREGRILVSHDLKSMPRHFRDFTSSGQASPGVFLIAQNVPVVVAINAGGV